VPIAKKNPGQTGTGGEVCVAFVTRLFSPIANSGF
jgi:hypothetical protein